MSLVPISMVTAYSASYSFFIWRWKMCVWNPFWFSLTYLLVKFLWMWIALTVSPHNLGVFSQLNLSEKKKQEKNSKKSSRRSAEIELARNSCFRSRDVFCFWCLSLRVNQPLSIPVFCSVYVRGTPLLLREGMGGWLIYASPDTSACSLRLLPPSFPRKLNSAGHVKANASMPWILMASAGNCSLAQKMSMASKLGRKPARAGKWMA